MNLQKKNSPFQGSRGFGDSQLTQEPPLGPEEQLGSIAEIADAFFIFGAKRSCSHLTSALASGQETGFSQTASSAE